MTHRLLQHLSNLDRRQIVRVEVGSESGVDRAKCIMSHLTPLLGHSQVDGADHLAACYGGTAALWAACHWAASPDHLPGTYALVVASDVAVYARGPARPTGGAGSVALLVGREAPLEVQLGTAGVHAAHHWDFYKPWADSEYPLVDGSLSIACYLESLSRCLALHLERTGLEIADFDAWCLHTPYVKLVSKAHARLATEHHAPQLDYERLFLPSLQIAKRVGNLYCASLYAALFSLLQAKACQRIAMFSYGSGCVSRLFSLLVHDQTQLQLIPSEREGRIALTPTEYAQMMAERERDYGRPGPWTPHLTHTEPNVYYLTHVDEHQRRHYQTRR